MVLFEGDTLSRDEWLPYLECSPEEFDRLLDRGLFERTAPSIWALRFVGTLILANSVWICIPKILKRHWAADEIDLANFERLSMSLEIYGSRSRARRAGQDSIATELTPSEARISPLRELEILASLIEWTSSYGFHEVDMECSSSDLNGTVNWSKTLNNSVPLHLETGILYDKPTCFDSRRHHSVLAVMQSRALRALFEKYRTITSSLIGSCFDLLLEGDSISQYWQGTDDLSISDLQDLLDSTNRDHEKDLILLLIALAEILEARRRKNAAITVYGTTAFELVWEDICRAVFLDGSALDGELSNPLYRLVGDKARRKTATQRPDIVLFDNDKTFILDAKYYADFQSSRPDLEDVRKQIFYALSLPSGVASVSGFLFPQLASNDVEYLGEVEMVHPFMSTEEISLRDMRFPVVHCIGLPWNRMLDCYLGRSSAASLREMILGQITGWTQLTNSADGLLCISLPSGQTA